MRPDATSPTPRASVSLEEEMQTLASKHGLDWSKKKAPEKVKWSPLVYQKERLNIGRLLYCNANWKFREFSKMIMGPVRICHSSHEFATQSSHSVSGSSWWQAKMASIEIWLPWRAADQLHSCNLWGLLPSSVEFMRQNLSWPACLMKLTY